MVDPTPQPYWSYVWRHYRRRLLASGAVLVLVGVVVVVGALWPTGIRVDLSYYPSVATSAKRSGGLQHGRQI